MRNSLEWKINITNNFSRTRFEMSSVPNRYEIPHLAAIRLKRLVQSQTRNERLSLSRDDNYSLSFYSSHLYKKQNRFICNNGSGKLKRTFSDSILDRTSHSYHYVPQRLKFFNWSQLILIIVLFLIEGAEFVEKKQVNF